ncbi:MAG: putative periplasmic serine endoprotease DegP-like precursor [Candidatus Accumulibacter phosphatis]|uniref:Putative periplasmic serine endoprotease DegP-like n=1 Tax=Candidatus Accumulibacter phosphatis TaxID=327160 RepID=A0A080LTH1_9PROT|nr:serine protease [Accumulibacter sp.]KFB71723.1 MAG: putative periplasmic serine endoprotease DegP-like precursor [Candidatus Accumulibacter phosphatis]MBL8409417.1 trypsin-like peptidase domain-containing protein [Accumulibacter sp.]HRF10522.1 serine protease [Candidatus Accumulibacter phosphatis]
MRFLSLLLSGIARWRAASKATVPGWRTTVVRITVLLLLAGSVSADLPEVIERVKPAVVVVGTHQLTRSPQFVMRGTGFVVGDGRQVATNAHVIQEELNLAAGETLVIVFRSASTAAQQRQARVVLVDKGHDLALLRIDGQALPALTLHDSEPVREGESVAFTGFPIGGALGLSPVTHRGIISSITPIVLPGANARQLNARVVQQIRSGSFDIYQLDATAYPGNSGGPLYETNRGEVIGIINMVFVKENKESTLSKPSGISFAIPVRFLRELMAQIK